MITATNISKAFKLYRSPADRLREIISRRSCHKVFQAVDNVSFRVDRGETLGIVGQNGAGKSTLLKLLTGVLIPDSGQVQVDGKITGLLELGTGFNSEFSGIDNIFLNGTYLGLSRSEIEDRRQLIIDFSELGDFIHEPLKTYSSGMVMRLAFAVAINADPVAFVVDEALSVGDAYFQQKCMRRIKEFKEQGGSIVFVSHELNAVKVLCDRAMLIDQGVIVEEGSPENVINRYNWIISKRSDESGLLTSASEGQEHGTFEVRIISVKMLNDGSDSNVMISGAPAEIVVTIDSYVDIPELSSGIIIRDRFGQDIYATNTQLNKISFAVLKGERYCIKYNLFLDIGPGKYTITAAVQQDPLTSSRRLHWVDRVVDFEVIADAEASFTGICRLRPKISISSG